MTEQKKQPDLGQAMAEILADLDATTVEEFKPKDDNLPKDVERHIVGPASNLVKRLGVLRDKTRKARNEFADQINEKIRTGTINGVEHLEALRWEKILKSKCGLVYEWARLEARMANPSIPADGRVFIDIHGDIGYTMESEEEMTVGLEMIFCGSATRRGSELDKLFEELIGEGYGRWGFR